jgi:uncharacterized protein YceH (UPF0502 family)
VEACLQKLAEGGDPLVRMLPQSPGQKEARYVQLLSGEPADEPQAAVEIQAPAAVPQEKSRVETLEAELAALKAEFAAHREEFAKFKKQFE